jgi:hypothetical protein
MESRIQYRDFSSSGKIDSLQIKAIAHDASMGRFLAAAAFGMRGGSWFQGIAPGQSRKAGKVFVGRDEFTTVLQGQRCQVSIGDEIGGCLSRKEQFLKYFPMLFRGMHDPNTRLIQPTLNSAGCFFQSERMLENSPVGGNPEERRDDRPTKTCGRTARKTLIPPFAGLGVKRT